MTLNIGQQCISCFEDTSFGSGKFVNRVPAEDQIHKGWLCADCMSLDCDRCGEPIDLDEDVTPNDIYVEGDPRREREFKDGAFRVHTECLTEMEASDYVIALQYD